MTQLDAIYFRNFRKARRMTVSDLARVLGLHRSTIGEIEAGNRRPSIPTLRKFEALLEKHRSEECPLRSR